MRISRRRMLVATGAWAGAAICPRAWSIAAGPHSRGVALRNVHTAERLDIEYFRDNAYLSDALAAIDTVLRDFRNGQKHAVDPKLLDYLVDVAAQVGAPAVYSVISGYRSPDSDERLRARSTGVSQHSLHIQGRAIDVRLSGVNCADLAAHALKLKRGGVGYYRASNFVHLDTGSFRSWLG